MKLILKLNQENKVKNLLMKNKTYKQSLQRSIPRVIISTKLF